MSRRERHPNNDASRVQMGSRLLRLPSRKGLEDDAGCYSLSALPRRVAGREGADSFGSSVVVPSPPKMEAMALR